MAFDGQNWGRWSSTANFNAPSYWGYASSTDSLATIVASGYFDDKSDELSAGDAIWVKASDDTQSVKVTAVSPNVTVEQFSEVVDDNSITTAKLAPGAIAAGTKMALPRGNVFIGDASGNGSVLDAKAGSTMLLGDGTDLTAVVMSGDMSLDVSGVASMANNAVTTNKILDANVTQAKIAANSLNGTVASSITNENVVGVLPVIHQIDTIGGSSGNFDVTITHKSLFLDAWLVAKGSGTAGDTIEVLNAGSPLTNTQDISSITVNKRFGFTELRTGASATVNAGAVLRVASIDGAGGDNPAVTVYVLMARIA